MFIDVFVFSLLFYVLPGILGFSQDRVLCSETRPASPHVEGVQLREGLPLRMEPVTG